MTYFTKLEALTYYADVENGAVQLNLQLTWSFKVQKKQK